jgi:hypothetical protein
MLVEKLARLGIKNNNIFEIPFQYLWQFPQNALLAKHPGLCRTGFQQGRKPIWDFFQDLNPLIIKDKL